jgi:hypothetical protein
MYLRSSIAHLFEQLKDLLGKLSQEQYVQPCIQLSNATIGQHIRHVIELFIELQKGYETGVVNYEKRKRDYNIETVKLHAAEVLDKVFSKLENENKTLVLHVNYEIDAVGADTLQTNYVREIVYNIEHTVHHMALIRIAVKEVSNIILPTCFGVAASTIKYRNT